jgi:hypothetical protein
MPEQISDDDFKSQMLRFVDVANQKFDGITSDVRTNSYRMDKFETKIDSLGVEIQHLTDAVHDLANTAGVVSKQFAAVTSKVFEHDQRLNGLDGRLAVLEGESN